MEKLGREDLLITVCQTLTKKDLEDVVRALDKVANATRKRQSEASPMSLWLHILNGYILERISLSLQ
jgi:hypothetical protein